MDFKQIFRRLFQFVTILRIVSLIINLAAETNGNREIGIRQVKEHGFIVVNNKKLYSKTTTSTSIIAVKCNSVFDYLFLVTEKEGNFLSGCIKLVMWCFILLYITKVDLNDPFDSASFKRVSIIGILNISSFILDLLGDFYYSNWFKGTYNPIGKEAYLSAYNSGIGIVTTVMIVAFYRIATYNQQQLAKNQLV